MKQIVIGILAAMLAAGAQTRNEAERMLKAAKNAELVDGNLNAAIKQYDAIIAKYKKSDRAVTAGALVRKAECLQKQGNSEARKIYEQVVKDYADQKEAVAVARARLGGGAPAGQQATRAVWTGPKADGYESSLSPDGRFITFPDWDTGNLGLHDLVTGADRLLTSTGTLKREPGAFAEVSAISRDGKQVAYAWWDGKLGRYELWVLSLGGDPNPRRVFGNMNVTYLEPRDWSPDGKWIAAYLWDIRNKVSQIGLIGAQDGSLRVLKSGTDDLLMGGFSSDGRYLVYTRGTRNIFQGYIISVDAKSEVPLVPGTSSAESPVWTPDGSRIVFVSNRSGSPGLWSIRVADGKPLGEPELLKAGFSDSRAVGFARDGSFFYAVTLNQTDIYIAGLDPATGKLTSEPRRVNERAVGNSSGRIAWLRDGKSLSFWNRDPIGTLVVHTLSTREEREIWGGKSGRIGAGYTGWFPDGSLMRREGLVFRRVDSRTGEAQATWTVPELPSGSSQPISSPDLMTIYFSHADQTVPCEVLKCTHVMVARDLETGRDREIFRVAGLLRATSISHDGRQIAIIVRDGLAQLVMIAPTAGGPPREIYRFTATDSGYLKDTTWTQDGAHVLAFRSLRDREGEVWSFPTKGGSPEKSPLRMRPSEAPAVSPDGTQIAFVGGNRTSEVWVMTGLFQDAKPAPAR